MINRLEGFYYNNNPLTDKVNEIIDHINGQTKAEGKIEKPVFIFSAIDVLQERADEIKTQIDSDQRKMVSQVELSEIQDRTSLYGCYNAVLRDLKRESIIDKTPRKKLSWKDVFHINSENKYLAPKLAEKANKFSYTYFLYENFVYECQGGDMFRSTGLTITDIE